MELELTKDSVADLLTRFVVIGQAKGSYSIKDASFLYKVVTNLKKEDGKTKENFDAMIRAIVVANTKGSYTLEEASIAEKIVEFLEKENLVTNVKHDESKDIKEV